MERTRLNLITFPCLIVKIGLFDVNMLMQILNRTNNIFELVTVEPVPDRLENHNKDILGCDIEGDENRNLRLKGM